MRASSEPQFGALREGGGTREAGSTVAESLVVLYRVGTHQIRRRRRAARSSTSQGRAEPLCARITGLKRDVSEEEAMMSDHGNFSSYEGHKRRRTGKIRGAFSRCAGLLTAGCWLARWLHQLKASTIMDLGISNFRISVQCVALRNLDLLSKLVGA